MLMPLVIVILAVLALWTSNLERKPRAMLIAMGLLCVVLGGRVVALISDSYADTYLNTAYADDTIPPSDPAAIEADGDQHADSHSELKGATSPSLDEVTSVEIASEPTELSVAPTTSFRYLTPRPDWVEQGATTNDDFYQVAVESGLYPRKQTAQQTLQEEVKSALDRYINDYLGSELASTLTGYSIEQGQRGTLETIDLRLAGKSYEIARDRFDEQVEFDYGVMNQSHALVKIDKKLQKALDDRWAKVRATSRLFQTGLGAGAILLLLGTMFSYLKLDTATRGYYTGRLQFGAAAAILAVIAAGVVCANWIPWM